MEGTSGAVGLALFSRRSGVCDPHGGHCVSEPVRRARFGSPKTLGNRLLQADCPASLRQEVSEPIGLGRSFRSRAIAAEGAGLGLNDAGP